MKRIFVLTGIVLLAASFALAGASQELSGYRPGPGI